MTPEQAAIIFHNLYEDLAPAFGYVTREETRTLDLYEPNGRLMVAVCARFLAEITKTHTLVPREPDVKMIDAGLCGCMDNDVTVCIYKAMLDAGEIK